MLAIERSRSLSRYEQCLSKSDLFGNVTLLLFCSSNFLCRRHFVAFILRSLLTKARLFKDLINLNIQHGLSAGSYLTKWDPNPLIMVAHHSERESTSALNSTNPAPEGAKESDSSPPPTHPANRSPSSSPARFPW